MQGRRRPDLRESDLPDDIQAGDYWKLLDDESGEPIVIVGAASNLTSTSWRVVAPMPSGGFAIGTLRFHTVREEDDGTISVRPGDGSSNSILIGGSHGQQWHGYIEHGVWTGA